ncbi:MAG: FeoA family protein [Burkholderiaceae bacterium]
MNLDQAKLRQSWKVKAVQADPEFAELGRQLEEIGFLPNEEVRVLTRGFPGGDPLVVQVGLSSFALRRHEAQMVQLQEASPDA